GLGRQVGDWSELQLSLIVISLAPRCERGAPRKPGPTGGVGVTIFKNSWACAAPQHHAGPHSQLGALCQVNYLAACMCKTLKLEHLVDSRYHQFMRSIASHADSQRSGRDSPCRRGCGGP